jgi:hypothetical protein
MPGGCRIFALVALLNGTSTIGIYVVGSRPSTVSGGDSRADNQRFIIAVEVRLVNWAAAIVAMPIKSSMSRSLNRIPGAPTKSQ